MEKILIVFEFPQQIIIPCCRSEYTYIIHHLMMLLIKYDKHDIYKHIIILYIHHRATIFYIYSRWQKIKRYRQIYIL